MDQKEGMQLDLSTCMSVMEAESGLCLPGRTSEGFSEEVLPAWGFGGGPRSFRVMESSAP